MYSYAAPEKIIEFPEKAVTRKVMDNGLTVLARRGTPDGLVAIDVKLLAGSGLEKEYLGSGISHLVEHMVFKGTKTRGVGKIEEEIKSYGGFINGFTSSDLTSYRVILPSRFLPQALEILRDMLANASFDEAELAKEKQVILKEIKLNEDEPQGRLIKRLHETAYARHPYKYPTIGYEKRFNELTRNDVVTYYDRMYVPNRMVISIVGGIDEKTAIGEVEKVFENFRAPNYGISDLVDSEPVQMDARQVDDQSRASLAYIAIGFHSTSVLDEDLFALDVLSMILGQGNNSRLNTSLVKNGKLAYSATSWNYTPKDTGLFVVQLVLDKDHIDAAEKAARAEIAKLRTQEVTDAELDGAKRQALSDYIASLQTLDSQAHDIGLSYMLTGSAEFSRRYVNGIQSVTKADIKKAANKYLRDPGMTVVRLLPVGYERKSAVRADTGAVSDTIQKSELANGLRVLVRRDMKTPAISITAAFLGGLIAETASDNGISNFTANMMLKGTKMRPEKDIQGYLEKLGGSIKGFSGFNAFGIKMDVLKPDLPVALDLLQDIISNSEFPADEIEKEKRLAVAAIREEDDDIFATGINALRSILFANSPYGLRQLGTERTVTSFNRDAISAFFKKMCVPNNLVISISGDIEPEAAAELVRAKFSGLVRADVSLPPTDAISIAMTAALPLHMNKEQSLVLLGFETVPLKDPDRYTLEVLSSVLSGYSGRLFAELRSKDPRAYALGCFNKAALDKGFFVFYVATTKESVDAVRTTILDEIRRIRKDGISEDELVYAKRELVSGRLIAEQSNSFYSFTSATDELYGLGYDTLYKYGSRIDAVTKDDVQRAAQKYLNPDEHAEVTITPQ